MTGREFLLRLILLFRKDFMLGIRISTAALTLLVPALGWSAAATPSQPIVAGYVFTQERALPPDSVDAQSMTRINYAFSNIANGRMVLGAPTDVGNLAQLTALRRRNSSLTVLVSVGGWLWSTNFSDISLTRESRKVFVQSVMEFLARYDLDGLDIDWEYPGMEGAGHPFRPVDKQNFTRLVKELRKSFNQQEKKDHRRLYLTIAAGASDDFLAHTEMQKVQKYLDTVNLMAYDYIEPSDKGLTGHHAPLYLNPADARHYSSDASVTAFERAGVPAGKLLLGVPFYGHIWGDVPDKDHGLFQPGKAVPKGYAPFGTIPSTMIGRGYVRYWDSAASAPYLYNAETNIFVSYDDEESLTAKCRYITEHKLGGIMFWEYSNDPTGTLLKVINQSLRPDAATGKIAQ
jgi:chitinase